MLIFLSILGFSVYSRRSARQQAISCVLMMIPTSLSLGMLIYDRIHSSNVPEPKGFAENAANVILSEGFDTVSISKITELSSNDSAMTLAPNASIPTPTYPQLKDLDSVLLCMNRSNVSGDAYMTVYEMHEFECNLDQTTTISSIQNVSDPYVIKKAFKIEPRDNE